MAEEEVKKFPFDVEFQKKILKLLIDDVNFLIKASKYLKPEYFDSEMLRWVYEKIIWYYTTYQKTITDAVFIQEVSTLKENQLEYVTLIRSVLGTQIPEKEYVTKKVEEFIKRNIFVKKFGEVATLYNRNHFDMSLKEMEQCLKEVNTVSFEAPHRTFFFEELQERIARRSNKLLNIDYRFTTGVIELDSVIGGGITRGELGIVVADAKIGKSIFLVNVGCSIVRTFGGKVLHINLEGKEGQVDDRYEARMLLHNYRDVTRNILPDSAPKQYKSFGDKLVISNFITRWDYTACDIEQELNDLKAYNFIPDVVIVDYGDLLVPRSASKDDKYAGQEECFRDLKTLAGKYNCAVWTASQVHRVDKASKPEEDDKFIYTRKNLADSYTKVRIADLLMTLNMTNAERRSNRMRVYLDAYRDAACGQIFNISTNYEKMQFYVPNISSYDNLNKNRG